MSKIKTAVITGQHAFDVPGFHGLFGSISEIDFYLQDLEPITLWLTHLRTSQPVIAVRSVQ